LERVSVVEVAGDETLLHQPSFSARRSLPLDGWRLPSVRLGPNTVGAQEQDDGYAIEHDEPRASGAGENFDSGSTNEDERIGMVVSDRYRILSILGTGGMGGVYAAEHLLIGKKVALKCLHREYSRDGDIVARFKREARAATLIGNEHIIDVTDMGDLPDGAPFLVMEHLAGKPLAALCDDGAVAIKRTVHICRQIANALSAAHDKGIVHRDMKPENVFLIERNGDPDFVKVLDFGISKMHSSGVDKGLTRTGMAMGTPTYMSPEQAQGSKLVDHRTDIWALGVMLYELLAARRPFDADSYPMLLMSIVATDPDPVSLYRKDLPPALADLIMKCMEKDLDKRVQTMRDLELGLSEFAEVDLTPELLAPGAREPGESATEKYKATALARKKSRAEMEPDGPSGTRPDGSYQGPASPATVVLQTSPGTRDQAPAANATMPKPLARDSVSTLSGLPVNLPTSNRGMIVGGVVGVLLVVGALAVAAGAFSGETTTAATPTTGTPSTVDTAPVVPSPPEPPTRVQPPEAPAQAQEVRIRIRVDPADARILIGGVEYPNPLDAPQVRSLTPTPVRIEREGYRAIEQLVVFSEDQSLMFQMSRGRGTEQRGTPATTMSEPAVTMEATTMGATTTMDSFRSWE